MFCCDRTPPYASTENIAPCLNVVFWSAIAKLLSNIYCKVPKGILILHKKSDTNKEFPSKCYCLFLIQQLNWNSLTWGGELDDFTDGSRTFSLTQGKTVHHKVNILEVRWIALLNVTDDSAPIGIPLHG